MANEIPSVKRLSFHK